MPAQSMLIPESGTASMIHKSQSCNGIDVLQAITFCSTSKMDKRARWMVLSSQLSSVNLV